MNASLKSSKSVSLRNLRLIFLIAFSCLTLTTFSQIEKGSFVIAIDGGGHKIASSSGVHTNETVSEEKLFNIGLSADYYLSNAFSLGLGFTYQKETEEGGNITLVYMFQEVNLFKSVSKSFIPSLRLGYTKKLFNNFYFKGLLSLNYGIVNLETKSEYYGCECIIPGLVTPLNCVDIPQIFTVEENAKVEFMSVLLQPEFHYYFNKKFGLSIGIGGLEYGIGDWDIENNYWVVNFNPNNWTVGLSVRI
jgi:hypothetical protein